MKIGKTRNKSGILRVLLGLAVAGALLFAACQDIFDTSSAQVPQDNDGYGYAVVDLGDWARTIRPDVGDLVKFEYIFTGYDVSLGTTGSGASNANPANTVSFISDTPRDTPFKLPLGKYKLEVKAYTADNGGVSAGEITNPTYVSATGVYKGGNPEGVFPIEVNVTTKLYVELTPEETTAANGTAKGTLNITITLPANAVGRFKLEQISGAGNPLGAINLSTSTLWSGSPTVTPNVAPNADNGGYYTAKGSAPFALAISGARVSGTYLFTGRINTDNAKYGGFSEAIHVVDYMTTEFKKDYTQPDALAAVNTPAEAIAILEDEIDLWVGGNPLTTVAGKGKDITKGSKIRLNYVAARTQISNSQFPITLQGGWQTDTNSNNGLVNDGTNNKSNWDVGNNSGLTTVTLKNPSVKTNAGNTGITPADATYIIELMPVAEYFLKFGDTVTSDADKAPIVVSVADPTTGSTETITLNAANPTASGIFPVGSTNITVTQAAITMGINGAAASYREPNATGVVVHPAQSARYDIFAYQTVEKQLEAAFDRLRDEITDWVVQKNALTRSPSNLTPGLNVITPDKPGAPEFTITGSTNGTANTPNNLPAYYNGANTVTLYYVASRLTNTTTFDINVPQDDITRWLVPGPWTLTTPAANSSDTMTIQYRPHGGVPKDYIIIWKPVAEFYVYYAEQDVVVDTLPVYPASSAVIIKEASATATSGITFKIGQDTGAFDDTTYKGRKFALGTTNIAITDVTITADITNAPTSAGLTNSWDYFPTGNDAPTTTPVNLDNTKILQTGSKDINATSREYHINVYRTIQKQKDDAIAEIRKEKDPWKWTSTNNTGILIKDDTQGLVSDGTASTNITSKLVYAGASAPDIIVREWDTPPTPANPGAGTPAVPGVGADFGEKGWSLNAVPTTQPTNTYEGTLTGLAFTPKGGIKQDDIYKIQAIPAVLYNVNYQKFPLGTDLATGTITVQGSGAGVATAVTLETFPKTDGSVGPYWAGLGADLSAKASNQQNLNAIKIGTNISDATGTATVAKASLTSSTTPYDVDVYPSVADQKSNYLSMMRRINKTTLLDGWVANTTSVVGDNLPDNSTTQPNTVSATIFNVVATTTPALTVTGKLNSGYTDLTKADVADENNYGTKSIKITFVANGTTTVTTEVNQDYTFTIQRVAQYNIVYQNGPTGHKNYGVTLAISTYQPGVIVTGTGVTITDADILNIPIVQGDPVTTYYGGIGTMTGGTAANTSVTLPNNNITSSRGNVFSVDAGSTPGSPNTIAVPIATTTSQIYTIKIYPTEDDQLRMVREKMLTFKNTSAKAWFGFNTSDKKNNLVPTADVNFVDGGTDSTDATQILEVQYLDGLLDSNDNVILTPFNIDPIYNSLLTVGNPVTENKGTSSAPVDIGVKKIPINFKSNKTGATASKVADIRTIPVAKYSVIYSNGATGTVTVTPTVTGAKPGVGTPINQGTGDQFVYAGLGATDVVISSTSAASYTKVQFRQADDVNNTTREKDRGNSATVTFSLPTDLSGAPLSKVYEILVIK